MKRQENGKVEPVRQHQTLQNFNENTQRVKDASDFEYISLTCYWTNNNLICRSL